MTREEAIEQLKQIPIHDAVSDNYIKSIYEAIDMAIEALSSSEIPNTCDDAISRQAALNAITMAEVRWQAVDNVNKLPSVSPQQRTGRWKRISIDKYSEHAQYWYRCDKCGKDNLGNTNFCPKCGAEMESEVQE